MGNVALAKFNKKSIKILKSTLATFQILTIQAMGAKD
jgi:hypothetical protein